MGIWVVAHQNTNELIKELLAKYAGNCPELFHHYSNLLESQNKWETDSFFVKKDNKNKIISIRLLAEI